MKELTIMQWIKQLRQPYRHQAIKNVTPTVVNVKRDCFNGVLMAAFIWDETIEGHDYWSDVYDEFYWGKGNKYLLKKYRTDE